MGTDPRPMGIGEILDRAISTYVAGFVPLFLIIAFAIIPLTLIQLLAVPGMTHMQDITDQMNRLPPADNVDRTRLVQQLFASFTGAGFFLSYLLLPVVAYPLYRTAIVRYANALYDGAPTTIAAAYREGVSRWGIQIVAAIAFFVVAFGIMLVMTIAFFLIGLIVAGSFAANPIFGTIVLVVLGLPVLVVVFAVSAMLSLVFELMNVAVSLEERNPFRALGSAFRRAFDPALRKRMIGVALAYLAVEFIGLSVLVGAGSVIGLLTHLYAVQIGFTALGTILINGVLATFIVGYARDVRLRREGSDLLLAVSTEPLAQ